MGAAGDELQRFLEEIRWFFKVRPAYVVPEKVMPSRAARCYRRDERRSRRR